MKRFIGISFCIFLVYMIQSTILSGIQIAGVTPNLLIILLIVIAYRYGNVTGLLAGFAIGLLLDFVEGELIGFYAFIYMLIGYLAGFAKKIYRQDDSTIPLLLVGLGDFICGFYIYIASFLLRNRLHFGFYLRTVILPELLYTVVISIFLYRLIHRLFCRIDRT